MFYRAGDLINLCLSGVDQIDRFAFSGVSHLDNAGACFDQASQESTFCNDFGVVAGVCCRGNKGCEGVQIFCATGTAEFTCFGQFIGDGDDVGGLPVGIQRQDRIKDDFVFGDIEIISPKSFDDIRYSVFAEQHATESALLSEQIMRRSTFSLPILT